MYRIRLKIRRGDMTIVNLSLLFSVIALLTAPWLVVLGILIALVMGYHISIDKSGSGFESSFEEVVENTNAMFKKFSMMTKNNGVFKSGRFVKKRPLVYIVIYHTALPAVDTHF